LNDLNKKISEKDLCPYKRNALYVERLNLKDFGIPRLESDLKSSTETVNRIKEDLKDVYRRKEEADKILMTALYRLK